MTNGITADVAMGSSRSVRTESGRAATRPAATMTGLGSRRPGGGGLGGGRTEGSRAGVRTLGGVLTRVGDGGRGGRTRVALTGGGRRRTATARAAGSLAPRG